VCFFGQYASANPILYTGPELFWRDSNMKKTGLHIVFAAFLWHALLPLASAQFTIEYSDSCLGMLSCSILMTWLVHRSWVFRIMVSMLVDLALSRASRFVTFSCHKMLRIDLRLLVWKRSTA
ncbi:hypothetical protein RRG08_059852, partial [Elysia crispata]